MDKKLQKIYPTYYNLLIAQDLSKAHNQILSIIFLEEFIKLNVSTDTIIKNKKTAELTDFKYDLIKYKCLCCNKNYQQSSMKSCSNDFLIHKNV